MFNEITDDYFLRSDIICIIVVYNICGENVLVFFFFTQYYIPTDQMILIISLSQDFSSTILFTILFFQFF